MKKIEGKSSGIYHASVNLFRDDLNKIIDILSEISEKVIISDGEFEYDSLDELENEKGLRPKKIDLKVYEPYVAINIQTYSIFLYRGDSGKDSIYAFKVIEEILKQRRTILSKIFNPIVGIIALVFLMVVFFIPNETIKLWFPSRWSRLGLLVPLFVILVVSPIISFVTNFGALSSINLQKSYDQTSFLYRQKDDLIKLIIGALLGALLTLLISYLKG